MKALVSALALVLLVTPALASSDRCLDGTAPAGWLRIGGYCDVAHDLRGPSADAFKGATVAYVRIYWVDSSGNSHVGNPGPDAVDIHYWTSPTSVTQVKDGTSRNYTVDAPFTGDWHLTH